MNKKWSYIKMLAAYFFLTTPLILIFTLASIPEAITIQPTTLSRVFFMVILFGLGIIFYFYIDPAFKELKYKTIAFIISMIASVLFLIISLSY
ncbi:hypothetical protein JOC25_002514 [Solibacillus kalamii]|uniref:Uncharacterized protein n=2 Tax=Solibacillus TaxID=648800 RepID=K1KSW3_9BACL|nr:Fe3+-hydroxamate ABC transporter substrate-binding protein [Solibacillus silvestris]EKB45596.1 hypothetical protein B857_01547 [Solibacillus isronensis B3W22]MBM7666021.1 hypothetical protein [Solibacillus kalamii]OUZ38527.1 Fe3+-hydroxamate ABC transporter substrate-binding protein [Solibacillus kalamii]